MRPFFGFHMPNYTYGVPDTQMFDKVAGMAQAAEKVGFDLVTVMDHFYQIRGVGPETEPMMEGYMTLAALATQTTKVMLGTMVTGVTYRNPAMLAKMATTLDVISKGRGVLGIGAAWNDSEHAGYGYDFPPIGEREDRLEEALTIIKAMFTQDRPSFEGKYYRIDRALNVPRPITKGGPKIMIGGAGEKRTLRSAARFADITNWFGAVEESAPKLAILDRHCEAVGRNPADILRTVTVPYVIAESEKDKASLLASLPELPRPGATPVTLTEGADAVQRFFDAGFDGVCFRNAINRNVEAVARLGEMISILRK